MKICQSDPFRNDDITLGEICDALSRRRRWVLISVLACLAGVGAYLLVVPPEYEARVKLRIGQVAGVGALEEGNVISAWLFGNHGEDIATGVKRPPPFLTKVAPEKGSQQVMELVASGGTPDQAVKLLGDIVQEVTARHQKIYLSSISSMQERVVYIEEEHVRLTQLLDRTGRLIDELGRRDSVQASLVALERARIATEMSAIERELPEWKQKLNPPATMMTEVLGKVAVSASPVAPNRALLLALGALLGLIGGMVLALILEFLVRARCAATRP